MVRHGETDFNRERKVQGRGINTSLNERGIAQAKALALRFSVECFDYICTSSLQRAIQTVGYITEEYHRHLPIHFSDELQEMDYGDWEGRYFAKDRKDSVYEKLQEIIKQWSQGNTNLTIPGGESPEDVEKRAVDAISKILHDPDANYILIVCHGRLLRILLCSLLGLGLDKMQTIEQGNTCVNVLEWHSEKNLFIPKKINSTEHLQKSKL